jgi:small-conductance mechanosensitive channel
LAATNEYYILLETIVEEMNILTQVFLWYDDEEIYYPNSALATDSINNFYYSPNMNDAVELIVMFLPEFKMLVH